MAEHAGQFKKGDGRPRRPKGVPNKATAEIKAVAQKYGHEALKTLVDLMRTAEDQKTRVAAANSILDRAYGKPAQAIVGDKEQPVEVNFAQLDIFTQRIQEMAERALNASVGA